MKLNGTNLKSLHLLPPSLSGTRTDLEPADPRAQQLLRMDCAQRSAMHLPVHLRTMRSAEDQVASESTNTLDPHQHSQTGESESLKLFLKFEANPPCVIQDSVYELPSKLKSLLISTKCLSTLLIVLCSVQLFYIFLADTDEHFDIAQVISLILEIISFVSNRTPIIGVTH